MQANYYYLIVKVISQVPVNWLQLFGDTAFLVLGIVLQNKACTWKKNQSLSYPEVLTLLLATYKCIAKTHQEGVYEENLQRQ